MRNDWPRRATVHKAKNVRMEPVTDPHIARLDAEIAQAREIASFGTSPKYDNGYINGLLKAKQLYTEGGRGDGKA